MYANDTSYLSTINALSKNNKNSDNQKYFGSGDKTIGLTQERTLMDAE